MNDCPWCKSNPGCPQTKGEKCDFQDLKYEKQEILDRVSKEAEAALDILQSKEINVEVSFRGGMDRLAAIKIMMDVLKTEFGISEEEVKKALPKSNALSNLRMALALKRMRLKRLGVL